MSRRFNLDPRAPSRAPPPPAPKAAAPAPAPSPAPPPRFGAPPPASGSSGPAPLARPAPAPPMPATQASMPLPTRDRKKTYLIAGAIAAILLVGGAVAIYAATELQYPNAYLLEDADERPSGVTPRQMTRSEMDGLGITENPGEMDKEAFDSFTQGAIRHDPKEVHAQALRTNAGQPIFVFALKFDNEEDARESAQDQTARLACTGRTGRTVTLLRDNDVVVAIFSDASAQSAHVNVVRALIAQNDDLSAECGPR